MVAARQVADHRPRLLRPRSASTVSSRAARPASVRMSGVLRRVQNGFVRSYALSLLGGALLVVLALLAVNLA